MTEAPVVLRPERAVLVVVDVQEKLLPPIFEKERVLAGARLLLRTARTLELPVVLTTQYQKGLGPTVPEIRELVPDLEPLDKTAFGCFGSAGFEQRLRQLAGRDQLLVAGIESHICVCQTVLGALAAGYTVHLASDAVSSRSEADWRVGLSRMERAGAWISSTEMAVYELLGRSDSPAFKQILPYLKGQAAPSPTGRSPGREPR